MLEDALQAIGRELDIYHGSTQTSTQFWVSVDNGVPTFYLQAPPLKELTAEFADAAALVSFMKAVNEGIDSVLSYGAMKQLEVLKVEKILRDSEIAALEKTVGDLPETQAITDAMAEADKMRQEADARLRKLAEAKAALEADAVAKAEAVKKAEAAATAEELAKAEELKQAEELKRQKG